MIPVPGGNSTDEEESVTTKADVRPPASGLSVVSGRPPSPERITVALVPKAEQELRSLHERTRLSKTDIVNRAITLYEFVEAHLSAGKDFLIRDTDTGETHLIVLM
jgi:hypothetical protein